MTDTINATEPSSIKTEDGYTFYRLPDGRYADNIHEERIDMQWNSYDEMVNIFHAEKISYSVFFD